MLHASQRGDLPARRAGGDAASSGYYFTLRVRRVLARSREEAARLRHEYVATEHILLGLVHDDGVATMALAGMGISIERVVALLGQKVRPGTASGRETDLPYTARAKKVLELAMSEARLVDQRHHVGTEHLLLGLLRE
jgi:ATP-dependent Clp protease ATP-binding subunit ClpC